MTLSRRMYLWALLGPTGINRFRIGGTLTRAKKTAPFVGFLTITARLSERPEIYGNGWDGSTAKGVKTGKILSEKILETNLRSSDFKSCQSTISIPAFFISGTNSSLKILDWRDTSSWVWREIAFIKTDGSMSGLAVIGEPSSRLLKTDATRTI